MKVLLVNGSPHKAGTTARALAEVEKTLNESGVETEVFWVGTAPIAGCLGCHGCAKTHRCVNDDLVNEFLAKAEEADGFIFGSPVYYASPNGAVLSLMDRAFYAAGPKTFRLKPASVVAAARRGGTTASLDVLLKYFFLSEMPVVTSTYWNMVHGLSAGEAEQDGEGLQCMRNLGRNMAWLLKLKEAGAAAGIPLPETEHAVMTNFIR